MSAHQESESFVLPPGTRALYIGPPKSGTTALQAAASAARDELYTHGVVYPGSGESHHREIYAFMGRRDRRGKSTRGRMTRQDIGRAPARGERAPRPCSPRPARPAVSCARRVSYIREAVRAIIARSTRSWDGETAGASQRAAE